MKQKAVVVRVNMMNGELEVDWLNSVLEDGWTVVGDPVPSTPGSILVIVQKE